MRKGAETIDSAAAPRIRIRARDVTAVSTFHRKNVSSVRGEPCTMHADFQSNLRKLHLDGIPH